MKSHTLENTMIAKELLPENVFNGMCVEIQHWLSYHGMSIYQLKKFITNTNNRGDYSKEIEEFKKQQLSENIIDS